MRIKVLLLTCIINLLLPLCLIGGLVTSTGTINQRVKLDGGVVLVTTGQRSPGGVSVLLERYPDGIIVVQRPNNAQVRMYPRLHVSINQVVITLWAPGP